MTDHTDYVIRIEFPNGETWELSLKAAADILAGNRAADTEEFAEEKEFYLNSPQEAAWDLQGSADWSDVEASAERVDEPDEPDRQSLWMNGTVDFCDDGEN